MEMTHSTIKLNANKLTLEEGCSAPHVRRALAEKLSQRYLEQHHREADQEEQDDVRDEEGRPVQLQLARKPDYVGEGEVQAEAHSQSNSTDRSLWHTLARFVRDLAIRCTDFPVLHLHVIVRSMARQLSACFPGWPAEERSRVGPPIVTHQLLPAVVVVVVVVVVVCISGSNSPVHEKCYGSQIGRAASVRRPAVLPSQTYTAIETSDETKIIAYDSAGMRRCTVGSASCTVMARSALNQTVLSANDSGWKGQSSGKYCSLMAFVTSQPVSKMRSVSATNPNR
uniref:Uncharacterized protein n=1 Tax=Anopheles atroparvus TaxID=41427 RepID=A0A182IR91_ANOAO